MKFFVVSLILFVSGTECKVFTRCRLAEELVKENIIHKSFLGNWVCLIEKVSNRNTAAFVTTPSGKKHYGLYQIPSRWCREGKKGGECNITCDALLDDDIRDDTGCAVLIFHKEGFKYWTQWTNRCKNDNHITNEIYRSCPDLTTPRSSPERAFVPRIKRRYPRNVSVYNYYNVMHRRI